MTTHYDAFFLLKTGPAKARAAGSPATAMKYTAYCPVVVYSAFEYEYDQT